MPVTAGDVTTMVEHPARAPTARCMPVTAGDITTVVEHPALEASGPLQAGWHQGLRLASTAMIEHHAVVASCTLQAGDRHAEPKGTTPLIVAPRPAWWPLAASCASFGWLFKISPMGEIVQSSRAVDEGRPRARGWAVGTPNGVPTNIGPPRARGWAIYRNYRNYWPPPSTTWPPAGNHALDASGTLQDDNSQAGTTMVAHHAVAASCTLHAGDRR